MAITYKSQFIEGWYQEGVAVGKAEGKQEGKAEGLAEARTADILRVLKSRNLRPTKAQRELIESCTDLDTLDTWFERSLTATKVTDLFED